MLPEKDAHQTDDVLMTPLWKLSQDYARGTRSTAHRLSARRTCGCLVLNLNKVE